MILKSPFNDKEPKIDPTAFVAPNAVIIGDIEIQEGANIWFSAVLRADWGSIKIGKNTSVQDNCTIHAEPNSVAKIGENCILGHNCMVHGPTEIGNNVLIGINATILTHTKINSNCVIAAGSVVTERTICKSLVLYGGIPAEELKIYENEKKIARQITMGSTMYVSNGKKFKAFFDQNQNNIQ
ncbi:MAG: gamma carbonic anhydrase family protein [Candidatus Lokiarchaeota archaeon]|nr:gamma carbonic anhydrase family protein [Candidatus Lokiarchaeota archaeon]